MKIPLLILMALWTFTNPAIGQLETTSDSINNLLYQWQKPDVPGIAIAVVKGGKLYYNKSYGMANIKKQKVVDSLTQFWIASVTKQFTATGIYMLEAEKKVNLEHSVKRYLPELPSIFEPVTIDHLLHHTSGIRDGFVLTALSKKTESDYTNENVFKYLQQQKEMNFQPGTEYEYNNSGYVLLAKIIESVSKESYKEFMKKNVFQPLGMLHTYVSGKYLANDSLAEGYHSKDYSNKEGSFEEGHFQGDTYGSTGVITTITDLVLWAKFIQAPGKLANSKQIASRLHKVGNLNDGKEIAYAGGLERFSYNGRTVYEHFGADEGFKANIIYFPSADLSIIGLTNNSTNYGLSKVLYSIADLILKNPERANSTHAKADTLLFEAYYYDSSKLPVLKQVKRFNNYTTMSDMAGGPEIVHHTISDNVIATDDPIPQTYKFFNQRQIAVIDPYYNLNRTLNKIVPVVGKSNFDRIVGTYYSSELQTSYEIKSSNNELILEFAPQIQFVLFRLTDNDFVFNYSGNNYIQFTKEGFEFSREGCRRLAFKRQ